MGCEHAGRSPFGDNRMAVGTRRQRDELWRGWE
jgi:hypothetical protein